MLMAIRPTRAADPGERHGHAGFRPHRQRMGQADRAAEEVGMRERKARVWSSPTSTRTTRALGPRGPLCHGHQRPGSGGTRVVSAVTILEGRRCVRSSGIAGCIRIRRNAARCRWHPHRIGAGWSCPGATISTGGLVQRRELEYASRHVTAIEINGRITEAQNRRHTPMARRDAEVSCFRRKHRDASWHARAGQHGGAGGRVRGRYRPNSARNSGRWSAIRAGTADRRDSRSVPVCLPKRSTASRCVSLDVRDRGFIDDAI